MSAPSPHYSDAELQQLGLQFYGPHTRIHRSVQFFGAEHIQIGTGTRIDAYTTITAQNPVSIGSWVHIGTKCTLLGGHGIVIGDHANVSHGVTMLSESDDFVAAPAIGALAPEDQRVVLRGRIVLHPYSTVGAHCVVMPASIIEENTCVGALSLVKGELQANMVYAGAPAKSIGTRPTRSATT